MATVSAELFGSRDLLSALGWRPTWLSFFRFSGLITLLMLGFLAVTILVGELIPVSPVVFQILLWICWLTWLGYFLPRHHARDLSAEDRPYRRAFWRELCFGIGFNFAMILRPMAVGFVDGGALVGSPWILAAGLLLSGLGAFMIHHASRQLGVSCAFFVYEYARDATPPVIDTGIYGLLRHPLFTGGICISVGLGICIDAPVAWELAAVNLAVLLPYLPVEDRRCSHAVGSRYVRYREDVGGIVPQTRRNLASGQSPQRENGSSHGYGRENAAGQKSIRQMISRQARRQ